MEFEPEVEETERGSNNGNGDGKQLGPVINLGDIKKTDGLIQNRTGQNIGVLVRAMSAHKLDESIQELKLANFASTNEADEYVAAMNECRILGMDATPIYEQMLARSAGLKQSYIARILDTLTHTTFTTNYQNRNNNDARRFGIKNPLSE